MGEQPRHIRLVSMHVCERVERQPDGSHRVIGDMAAIGSDTFPVDFSAVIAVRFAGAGGPTRLRVDFVRQPEGVVTASVQHEFHVRASAEAHGQLLPVNIHFREPARYELRAIVNDGPIGSIDFEVRWDALRN